MMGPSPSRMLLATSAPDDHLAGDCPEDTRLLRDMAVRARAFLTSHSWCGAVRELRLGDGVGKVVALFLARIEPRPAGAMDEWLWVVVGDLPSAYHVLDDTGTPSEALDGYCGLMESWIDAVQAGGSLDEVYPVRAPATAESARALASRVDWLREVLIPQFALAYELRVKAVRAGQSRDWADLLAGVSPAPKKAPKKRAPKRSASPEKASPKKRAPRKR